jgi:hypothetical protein
MGSRRQLWERLSDWPVIDICTLRVPTAEDQTYESVQTERRMVHVTMSDCSQASRCMRLEDSIKNTAKLRDQ